MSSLLRTPPSQSNTKQPQSEIPRRLVVELSRRTAADLAWLVEEEEMNKTTIVNRAVQIYHMIVEAQRNGRGLCLEDAEGRTERLVIV